MIAKIRKKLRNRAGESIAETLIALLISCLALVMLAEAMSASSGIITKSRNKLKRYYNAAQNMDIRNEVNTEAYYTEGTGTAKIEDLYPAVGEKKIQEQSKTIKFYENGEFGGTPVIAYKIE